MKYYVIDLINKQIDPAIPAKKAGTASGQLEEARRIRRVAGQGWRG